ncbi:MAG: hypothetical protein OCD01_09775 [Fibrobacterales bacterium]
MKITLLFTLLACNLLFAGPKYVVETERTPKQIAKVEKYIYEITKELFKKPKMEYLKKEFKAPWKQEAPYSKKSFNRALTYLDKHSKVSIVDGAFGRKRVVFEGEFPKNMTDLKDRFYLELNKTRIKNKTQKRISFNPTGMTKWGVRTIAGASAGEAYSDKWENIRVEFQSEEKPGTDLSGDLTFNAQFITKYDNVKLTKKSKGKKFTLGKHSYRVISVKHNKIVLETKNRDLESFDYVNLNKSGKAYVRMTFGEHQIRGGQIKPLAYRKVARKRIQTVDKVIYKAFAKKSSMKFKRFKRKFDDHISNALENDKIESNVYIVLESAAPINNFYMFAPVFQAHQKVVRSDISE